MDASRSPVSATLLGSIRASGTAGRLALFVLLVLRLGLRSTVARCVRSTTRILGEYGRAA